MKKIQYQQKPNREWLQKMAGAEDECGIVTAGGLADEVEKLNLKKVEGPRVFGRLIEFARRKQGLSPENLANKADIDLGEMVAIENNESENIEPRTVYQLAHVLGLSPNKLIELAGLAESRDEQLNDAALRFAARSEPTTNLTEEEREAFEEFVKVLAESS